MNPIEYATDIQHLGIWREASSFREDLFISYVCGVLIFAVFLWIVERREAHKHPHTDVSPPITLLHLGLFMGWLVSIAYGHSHSDLYLPGSLDGMHAVQFYLFSAIPWMLALWGVLFQAHEPYDYEDIQ